MNQAVAQGTRRRMGDAANKLRGHGRSGLELAREVGNVTGRAGEGLWTGPASMSGCGVFRAGGVPGSRACRRSTRVIRRRRHRRRWNGSRNWRWGVWPTGATGWRRRRSFEGERVSSITIQKIVNDNGLGTRQDRWLELEKVSADKALELIGEHAAFREKPDPCFRERHVESAVPGVRLSADTFFVGSLKGVSKVIPAREDRGV